MHHQKISSYLKQLGFTPSRRGYYSTQYAILFAYENPLLLKSITKKLYPLIAKKLNESVYSVEKNIRYSIEQAWLQADNDLIDDIFKYSINAEKAKPTNLQFIATMAEHIRLEIMLESISRRN